MTLQKHILVLNYSWLRLGCDHVDVYMKSADRTHIFKSTHLLPKTLCEAVTCINIQLLSRVQHKSSSLLKGVYLLRCYHPCVC